MTSSTTFSEYTAHLREFMEQSSGGPPVVGSLNRQTTNATTMAGSSLSSDDSSLTSALSPEERENCFPSPDECCISRLTQTQGAALPLPAGEGWGEGERTESSTETQFNQLARSLFSLQFAHNLPYQQFCRSRRVTPVTLSDWREIPAIPTSAFKELELTSLSVAERTVVFHSSGTTEQRPSRHFHNAESMTIYEASLLPWFRAHLLAGLDKSRFFCLTPDPSQAPHSSLVHMFDMVSREFGSPDSIFTGTVDRDGAWLLDVDKTVTALRQSEAAQRPVVLLGTAFSFVHLLDQLAEQTQHFNLPPGARVLETGGYKGRSRTLPKAELHELITQFLGIPAARIVCEYGMSELSSQAYDRVADNCADAQRNFHFPPWARVKVISPETGREVADGETGLLRVYDLANVRSVMAIQTEDLAVRRGDGFELIGRASLAEPRGCSLMAS